MQNLIGAIVIALAVGGAIAYNGHQDRLQRQCLAALASAERLSSYLTASVREHSYLYSIKTMTGSYCDGYPTRKVTEPKPWD